MVENSRTAFRALQENSKKLACTNIALRCEDGLEFARRETGRYDVIFLDPPFQGGYLPKVLPLLADRLAKDGLVYVETGDASFEPDAAWQVVKAGRAGKVFYQLLIKRRDE